jgi:predicted TIM-barrel fold metal-dependent hydrolase
VISHLGNPKLVEGELIAGSQIFRSRANPWRFRFALRTVMFCAYPNSELRHLVVEVIRRFGANRLMWGSNFPVCGDENAYGRDLAQLLCSEWGLSSQQIECIAGGTARTVWFDSERADTAVELESLPS